MNREQLEKLSPEVQGQLNVALHETLCKTINTLLQDTLENPELMKEEIQSAIEFAQIKPDTDAAKELIELRDERVVLETLKSRIIY